MNLERTIRQLKESNTIGPNPQQLKVKDFFPKQGISGFVWRLDKGPTSPIKI